MKRLVYINSHLNTDTYSLLDNLTQEDINKDETYLTVEPKH